MKIRIENPGVLTTVQDQGRYGYMEFGVRTGGVMDLSAYAAGNRLVGNAENAACLEMTLMGITAVFEGDGVIALTGAGMKPRLDGMPLETGRAVPVHSGQRLSMGISEKGCRGYFFAAGGIDVPEVMGSRSTDVKCHLGGLEGRALKAGDILKTGTQTAGEEGNPSKKSAMAPEKIESKVQVRAVEGPQADWFSEEARERFFRETYTVSAESDRMGMRLNGWTVESLQGVDIVSDGIVSGSIQITKSGMPIVMMADHQTTGGYAKIATVCSFDLPKLAQLRPGDAVCFRRVTVEEAQRLYCHPEEQNRTAPLAFAARECADSGKRTGKRHKFQKYCYYYRHGAF